MDKNETIAAALLPLLGGAGNIANVSNCITRMRVTPVDRSLFDEDAIKKTPGVMGIVDDETYQIVLGPGTVTKVTTAFSKMVEEGKAAGATVPAAGGADADMAAKGAAMKAAQKAKNDTPIKNLLRKIANIFVPLIPALIGAGLVAAIRGVLVNMVGTNESHWAYSLLPVLTAIGSAFFTYLAIFAGINAAKEFGGTPALGGAVAAIIVFPGVSNITYKLPGMSEVTLAPGMGGVLGAIAAAALCAWIERSLRGKIPDAIDILVTPTVALLVSGLATIYIFMYFAGEISTAIGDFANWLLETSGLLAGFVLGGLFLPLVMLGLHQALIPIHATLIEQYGYTSLLPILAMAGAGQVGCAATVYLKLNRNVNMRDTIKGALPVGILGVGEPLIYAVSLPLGRPFITACLGGAVGGAVVGGFAQFVNPIGATAIGPSGWALIPLVTGPGGQAYSIMVYMIGLFAGYIAGFIFTYLWGFTPDLIAEHNTHADEEFEVPGYDHDSAHAGATVHGEVVRSGEAAATLAAEEGLAAAAPAGGAAAPPGATS